MACLISTSATLLRYCGVVDGGSSTVTAVFLGYSRLYQDVMVPPPDTWMCATGRFNAFDSHCVTALLPPEKSTDDNGWWIDTIVRGWISEKKRTMARVSGSDAGRGPDQYRVPLPCFTHVLLGKLRLRSTPRALTRVPRTLPSGFIVGTTHRATSFTGSLLSRRSRAIRRPAGSSPCICPITR